MPCYEHPPPWEGAQRKNAEQAVKLLCADVTTSISSGKTAIDPDLLRWYIAHREIDVIMSEQPYHRTPMPEDAADAMRARSDIARARRLLGVSQ